jgi:hypothetical protein
VWKLPYLWIDGAIDQADLSLIGRFRSVCAPYRGKR